MNVETALRELKETWGYTTEELNDIREKMEEVASVSYAIGYSDRKIDEEVERAELASRTFTAYGDKEDW